MTGEKNGINDSGEVKRPVNLERGNSAGNLSNSGFVARHGEWIYFNSFSGDGGVYKKKEGASEAVKINDDRAWYINVLGDWIYFVSPGDGYKIYKMRTEICN